MLNRAKPFFVAIFIIGSAVYSNIPVSAEITDCSAVLSTNNVAPRSSRDYAFEITNNDSEAVTYIKISRPSDYFYITNTGADNWSGSNSPEVAYESEGTLLAGETIVVTVSAVAANVQAAAANWIVETSNIPDQDLHACSGYLATAITGNLQDEYEPTIFNISVNALNSTSVEISWVTNEPATSHIEYKLAIDEDFTVLANENLVTNHIVKLSNLLPDTGYFFQISSTDSSGNIANSTNNTFLTPLFDPLSVTSPITTGVPVKSTPTETIKPTVNFSTDFSAPQKTSPVIRGIAEDNEAVAGIFYSIDGGKNWLPITDVMGAGTKKALFSFFPQNLQDGNYEIKLSVIDTSSNEYSSDSRLLIIDRLSPTVGGSEVAVGSQVLLPGTSGTINSIIGINQKITLSAVGGPISVTIFTTKVGETEVLQSFSLTQSPDNGLWSGILNFSNAGTFQLVASSIDGANNHTLRLLNIVNVTGAGKITDTAEGAVKAKISIYTLELETNKWILWDGEAYDQFNPLNVSEKGEYGFYLPVGKYYFKIISPEYQSIVTRSFSIDSARAVNSSFKMKQKPGFTLGPLNLRVPWPVITSSTYDSSLNTAANQKSDNLDKLLPQFSHMQTNGKILDTAMLYGKPTILTFINTWSASATNQLDAINNIGEPNINLITVGSGESLSKLSAYALIAGYDKPIMADTDSQLIQELGGTNLPVSYFIDRHGMVKKIVIGILSEKELLDNVII